MLLQLTSWALLALPSRRPLIAWFILRQARTQRTNSALLVFRTKKTEVSQGTTPLPFNTCRLAVSAAEAGVSRFVRILSCAGKGP